LPPPLFAPLTSVFCRLRDISHDKFSENCVKADFGGCAENVLYNFQKGDSAAAESMQQWFDSSGHLANIMGNYAEVGYGFFKCDDGRVYWTGLYGT
jgi:uncharacterized protein YkwD